MLPRFLPPVCRPLTSVMWRRTGTGAALGDPIEVGALAAVFGPGRDPSPEAGDRVGQGQYRTS